jgi:hypothetical protein
LVLEKSERSGLGSSVWRMRKNNVYGGRPPGVPGYTRLSVAVCQPVPSDLLDNWAQAGQAVLGGISLYYAGQQIEYWPPIQLDPIGGRVTRAVPDPSSSSVAMRIERDGSNDSAVLSG